MGIRCKCGRVIYVEARMRERAKHKPATKPARKAWSPDDKEIIITKCVGKIARLEVDFSRDRCSGAVVDNIRQDSFLGLANIN